MCIRDRLRTDQNIGIAGKAGFMPFRISLGYNTEKGTLKTSKYERYTLSLIHISLSLQVHHFLFKSFLVSYRLITHLAAIIINPVS